jgi:pentatricopeptide repeat protein
MQKTATSTSILQVPLLVHAFGRMVPTPQLLVHVSTRRAFSTVPPQPQPQPQCDQVEKEILQKIKQQDFPGALLVLQEFAQGKPGDDQNQLQPKNFQPKINMSVTFALIRACAECVHKSQNDRTKQTQAAQVALQGLQLENLIRHQNRLIGQPKRHFRMVLEALVRIRAQKDDTSTSTSTSTNNNGEQPLQVWNPGHEAELILENARQVFHVTRHADDEVFLEHYHLVLETYRRNNQPDQADRLLKMMGKSNGLHFRQPDIIAFRIVVEGYLENARTAHSSGQEKKLEAMKNIRAADALLRYLLKERQQGQKHLFHVDLSLFHIVMNAWSKSNDPDGAQRVESLYQAMIQSELYPDIYTYMHRIDAHANLGDAKGAEDAFLDIYQTFHAAKQASANATTNAHDQQSNPYAPVDINCFNAVLKAWERSNDPHRLEKMDDLLKEARNRYRRGKDLVGLNTASYTTLLAAYAKTGHAGRAARLVQDMENDARSGNSAVLMTDPSTYGLWLKAVVMAQTVKAGEQADFILQELTRLRVQPNAYIYATAIACWKVTISIARKTDHEKVARGKARIQELERLLEPVDARRKKAN